MSFASYLPRFDTFVVDGPDVHGLRRLIMGLALAGQLDDPDANDAGPSTAPGAASDGIQREVADALGVSSLTCQFERFATVAEIKKGLTPIERASPGAYPLVVTADTRLSCDHFDFEGKAVLIPMVSSSGHGNASLKRLHYQEGQFAVGNILCAAFPRDPRRVSARFLYEYLTAFKDELLVSRMVGTANVSLTLDKIGQVPIPMIASSALSRLDELMTLCDELERAHKEREVWRNRLRSAVLHRLTSSDGDRTTGLGDVRFFLGRTPRLITKPEHVAAIRHTIVDLAVRGRLVPQDPANEPALDLLRRIANLKGSPHSGAPAEVNVKPFQAPRGWEWTSFGRLITDSEAGWSPKTENFRRSGEQWAVLKVSAVSWDRFRPEENKQLLPGVEPRLGAQVRSGDFLISRANTAELVARAVLVTDSPRNLMLSDKIVRLRLVKECEPRYLLLVNNSADYARTYYARSASGASPSMKNVSREVIYGLPIPFPPLAEQRRIVSKVQQLMALCDELEAALASMQAGRDRLLEAVLFDALNGAAVPKLMRAG